MRSTIYNAYRQILQLWKCITVYKLCSCYTIINQELACIMFQRQCITSPKTENNSGTHEDQGTGTGDAWTETNESRKSTHASIQTIPRGGEMQVWRHCEQSCANEADVRQAWGGGDQAERSTRNTGGQQNTGVQSDNKTQEDMTTK